MEAFEVTVGVGGGCENNIWESGGTAAVEGEDEEAPSTTSITVSASTSTSFQNIPCLVCGTNSFVKLEESEGNLIEEGGIGIGTGPTTTTLNGTQLLKKFCQLMKSKNGSKVIWEESEGEGLPICGDCRGRLSALVGMERKVRELELAYQEGVREFRRLCEGAEDTFEGSGIYDKDPRYYKFRRQIVRIGRSRGRPKRGTEKLQREKGSTRRSARRSNNVRMEGPSILASFSPVVSVSADDRAQADEFQMVKKEAVPWDGDNGNDDGPDDFPLGSPGSMNYGAEALIEGDDNNCQPLRPNQPEARTQRRKRQRKSKEIKPHSEEEPKERIERRGRKPNPPTAGVPNWVTLRAERKRKVETKDCDLDDSEFEEEMMKRKLWNDKMEEDDSDFEIDDKTQPEAAAQESEDDEGVDDGCDAEDDLSESSNRKLRPDPVTGLYSFLKVRFRPLQDNPDNLECLECHATIRKPLIRKHTYRCHSSVFKCPTCGQCFSTGGTLERHILRKHKRAKKKRERKRKDCPICGRPCFKEVLKLHMTTHYSEQDKAEAIARGEVVRTWRDRDPKRLQCDLCGKGYVEKLYLEKHMLREHSQQPEDAGKLLASKELCPECGLLVEKTYMSTHRLRTHNIGEDGRLLTPEAARPFICSYCDKRFFTNSLLLRHRRVVHEKIYPFKCTLCPRSFANQEGLDTHINGHNGVRPFPCPNCPSAFFTQGNLKRHQELYHMEGGNPKRTPYMRGSTAGIPKHPRYGKRKNIHPPPHSNQSSLQE